MGKNALAFVAGLGGGYLQAQQRQQEQDRQDKLDKIQTDRAAREQTEFDQRRADSQTLRDAARPANVQEGAGGMLRPDTMDNRDVGLPENAELPNGGLSPQAYRVNGQGYDAQAPALAAAKAYDSPQALAARQAAALNQVGQPAQALQLQNSQADLDTKHAERVRKVREENIVDALQALRRGDGKSMVAAFNKSGDYKIDGDAMLTPEVREIPGVGKVTTHNATFNVVGPDGKAVPMTVNSHDLSMQYMPYEKALSQQLAQVKGAAEVGELNAKAGYYNSFANQKDAQAKGAGASDKPLKLDEDDKIVFNDANTRVRESEKMLNEAYQKLMSGDDPEKSPAVLHAKQVLQQAKANQFRTHVRLGVLSPETIANDIVSNAKAPDEVLKSLGQLAGAGGTGVADQVAVLIQQNDEWKKMAKRSGGLGAAGPQTPTGKAVAAAPPSSVSLASAQPKTIPRSIAAVPGAKADINVTRGTDLIPKKD